jgi:hypothetical protein
MPKKGKNNLTFQVTIPSFRLKDGFTSVIDCVFNHNKPSWNQDNQNGPIKDP